MRTQKMSKIPNRAIENFLDTADYNYHLKNLSVMFIHYLKYPEEGNWSIQEKEDMHHTFDSLCNLIKEIQDIKEVSNG